MAFAAGDWRQDMSSQADQWTDDDPTVELGGHAPAPAAPAAVEAATDDTSSRLEPGHRGSEDPLSRGDVLRGRYRIEETIGTGGRSIVYRARDLRCEADDTADACVAIKVLKPDAAGAGPGPSHLKSEFRCLRSLSHPGIVRVFDLDRDGNDWFLVMELLAGQSLARLLQAPAAGSGDAAQKLGVIFACAEALVAAHERGVVHGDIKPANIFVTAAGDVRLIDFGAASVAGPGGAPDTPGGSNLATPAYASPQVLAGSRAEATDDLFSLACAACEWLTGRHPFERADPLDARRRGMTPAGLGTLDAAIAAALERGLAWEREDRPATVREWLRMLRDGVAAPRESLATAAPVQPARRTLRPAVLWSAVAALLALAVLAVWLPRTFERAPAAAVPEESRPAPTPAQHAPAAAIEPAVADAAVTPSPAAAPESTSAPLARPAAAPAVVAQHFTFAAEAVSVSSAATAAALRLSRTGPAAGRATVSWRIVSGSARAGRDYTGPASGTLSFADGQSTSTLFVPLVAGAAGDTSFTVEIVGTSRGTGIGDVPGVRVDIRRVMPPGSGAPP